MQKEVFVINYKINPVYGWEGICSLIEKRINLFPRLAASVTSLEEYAKKIDKNGNAYACMLNECDCGLIVFYCNDFTGKEAFISLIGVDQEHQGKKLGQLLLECCVEKSLQCGMNYLKLEVGKENKKAQSFYYKNGFENYEETNRNSIIMIKKLA